MGTVRTADGKGVVRMEDRFDTGVDDLWSALTEPGRLARWVGEFEGELSVGEEFPHVLRTGRAPGGWTCASPRGTLVVTKDARRAEDTSSRAVTAEGDQTLLVVEERGCR